MELKDFIETTLVSIAEGMDGAQKKVGNKLAINPGTVAGVAVAEKHFVNFDVALAAEDGNVQIENVMVEAGAKFGGLFNFGSRLGAEDKKNKLNKSANRVTFQIPVYYGATITNAKTDN